MTSIEVARTHPAGARPSTIFAQTLGPGQEAMFRFEIEGDVGKLYLPGTIEPVIVLDTQPVDLTVQARR